MKKYFLISCLIILTASLGSAQEILSVSGDYFENTNGSISITIGEPVTETFASTSNIMTQGFQQSRLTIVSIFEFQDKYGTITIAPNPTNDFLHLNIDDPKDMSWQICDLSGKILKESNLLSQQTDISFSELSSAVYFLTIIQGNQKVKTFQVIKK